MIPQQQAELERRPNFTIFLVKFGLKGMSEYQGLTQQEKEITLTEYLKRTKSRK